MILRYGKTISSSTTGHCDGCLVAPDFKFVYVVGNSAGVARVHWLFHCVVVRPKGSSVQPAVKRIICVLCSIRCALCLACLRPHDHGGTSRQCRRRRFLWNRFSNYSQRRPAGDSGHEADVSPLHEISCHAGCIGVAFCCTGRTSCSKLLFWKIMRQIQTCHTRMRGY